MEHLRIRPYANDDAKDLFLAAQESIAHIEPWMDWCNAQFTLQDAEDWVTSRQLAFQDAVEFNFVITDTQNSFLGACAVNQINTQDRRANLGYWVRQTVLHQGVASSALRLLADWAFANTEIFRLEIVVAKDNLASLRTAAKVGAISEGIARSRLCIRNHFHDATVFSILKSEWREPTSHNNK